MPLITHASKRWDADVTSSEATSDFFEMLTKLCSTLSDAVGTLDSGFVLRRPDKVRRKGVRRAQTRPRVGARAVGGYERNGASVAALQLGARLARRADGAHAARGLTGARN